MKEIAPYIVIYIGIGVLFSALVLILALQFMDKDGSVTETVIAECIPLRAERSSHGLPRLECALPFASQGIVVAQLL